MNLKQSSHELIIINVTFNSAFDSVFNSNMVLLPSLSILAFSLFYALPIYLKSMVIKQKHMEVSAADRSIHVHTHIVELNFPIIINLPSQRTSPWHRTFPSFSFTALAVVYLSLTRSSPISPCLWKGKRKCMSIIRIWIEHNKVDFHWWKYQCCTGLRF